MRPAEVAARTLRHHRRWLPIAALAVVLVAGGCLPPAPSAPAVDPVAPIYDFSTPDPAAVWLDEPVTEGPHAGAQLIVYSTQWWTNHVPMRIGPSSDQLWPDPDQWWLIGDALPTLPEWADEDSSVWAPHVAQVADGSWVLFFAAVRESDERRCIGRAVADSPFGPFVADEIPFACVTNRHAIDPFLWVDPTAPDAPTELVFGSYEPWGGTRIHHLRLDPTASDAAVPGTQPNVIFEGLVNWEDTVVENPELMKVPDGFQLLYSGNFWDTADYAIGAASCPTLDEACLRQWATPILASRGALAGPGGTAVASRLQPDGSMRHHLFVHGWKSDAVGHDQDGYRALWEFELRFDGEGRPFVV